MCLFTKQICPLRARKDKICYKRFEVVSPWLLLKPGNLMKTAIRGVFVRIPTTDEPTVMVAYPENYIERIRTMNLISTRFQIYGGMIHAYTNLESSKAPWPTVVFKCIITKGTLYYKGTGNDICAKKMLVVEQVK